MLTVTFNLRDGTFSDIPDDAHELIIEGYGKLTSSQQVLLKRYIIKHQLDISLQHGVPSSPLHSLNIIKTLRTFVKESKVYHPRFHNIIYGWCFIILMFALPIYLSYHISDGLQHYVAPWLSKLSQISLFQEDKLQHILFGHYGVISLGTYSFIWALPVVFMISLSTALVDISHLKHHLVWSIEPTMLRLGLHGADIIPLLEGFGCNAAAITQATHQCTKVQCMSLVSFGTACSYQIGATLSIFNASQKFWLFLPYLCMIFIGGIIHNKLWYSHQTHMTTQSVFQRQPVRWPKPKLLMKAAWRSIAMFIVQALPIFIVICLTVSLLSLTPILTFIANAFIPLLWLLDVPTQLAPGILFSMIRKDGMLLFNMNDSALIQRLSAFQLLLLVFFSSTFTACSVTMTMLIRRLGSILGIKMIMKQMVSSTLCVIVLVIAMLSIAKISDLGVMLWKSLLSVAF
ncbi:nucleoside recognition domain-containing protein [Staphylococcus epidermidis]|uniref:nucleoside recognition domain-containing protein n=1 Tax=Staphylococcus epidermidis TaxID=1282 RepID=UPI003989661B